MALVNGGIERILIKYPHLDLSNVRFVGYGAGQNFRDYFPFIKDLIKLEYTVCPIHGKNGETIHGIEVREPKALLNEPKDRTVVVIFSAAFFNIMHEIRDCYGNLACIRSHHFTDDFSLMNEIEEFSSLDIQPFAVKRKKKPSIGIFIQGMATEETPFVLAWNRMHHPHAYQCMATWDHVPQDLLDRCRPWLDHLILTPQPENTGYLYTNAAMRSARKGVEHLSDQGIPFAIRARSDSLLVGSSNKIIEKYFSHDRNKGKIAIPMQDGWPYVPFMFGVNTMIARTEDLLRFWSMPEDPREPNHPDFNIHPKDDFLKLRHTCPESIWWGNYAKSLGFPTNDLVDSVNFVREKLLPLQPDWNSVSLKFIPLFCISSRNTLCYTPKILDEIYQDPELAIERIKNIQLQKMSIADLHARRVG